VRHPGRGTLWTSPAAGHLGGEFSFRDDDAGTLRNDLALRHLAGQPMSRDEALSMRGARAMGGRPGGRRTARRRVILADTSACVEFDRATGSGVDRRMTELIASDDPLAITEPVLMEVLAGARDDRRTDDLRRLLLRSHLLAIDPAADFDVAARI
jgi:hypothetical protein